VGDLTGCTVQSAGGVRVVTRCTLQASLDKARAKSEAVVGQEDVPMRSKLKEVEKIYARARAAAAMYWSPVRTVALTMHTTSTASTSASLSSKPCVRPEFPGVKRIALTETCFIFMQSDKKKKAGTGRRRETKSKARPLDRRMMSDKRQTNMKVRV
jgi:hypothetical protein